VQQAAVRQPKHARLLRRPQPQQRARLVLQKEMKGRMLKDRK
jgi:hypothetical protein